MVRWFSRENDPPGGTIAPGSRARLIDQNPPHGSAARRPRLADVPAEDHGERRATHFRAGPQLPDISITWNAAPPDKLRLVKKFHLWPLQFKLGATYDRHQDLLSFDFSCKDQIIKGRLTLSTADKTLFYKKFFPLGSGMQLALNAQCNYESLVRQGQQPDYRVGFGIEFGANNFTMVGNSFDVRHKLHLTKNLVAEVCGNIRIPLPDARYSSTEQAVQLGDGDFQIHVEQVNAILKL